MSNKKIQILRAIAITAVVCIHTCPGGRMSVFIRPFLNYSVALFIFISGYLTNMNIDNIKSFYKKRILRVLIPYVLWTVFYTVVKHEGVMSIAKNLITAKACYTLYYIPAYIQFVIITPFIEKIWKSKLKYLIMLIQPMFYIWCWYLNMPFIRYVKNWFFASWFIYYYVGMLMGNGLIKVHFKKSWLWLAFFAAVLIQIAEGLLWYRSGDTDMATTQRKLTNILTSMTVICISYVYLSEGDLRQNIIIKWMILLGNCSFGIFLVHPYIITTLKKISVYNMYPYPITALIVAVISLLIVVISQKVLGRRICRYIGFA